MIDVKYLASLTQLSVTPKESKKLQAGFEKTMETIKKLRSLACGNTTPVTQVTNLTNITRQDKLQPQRTLTQKQALANAKRTHKGYFVVKAVIDQP